VKITMMKLMSDDITMKYILTASTGIQKQLQTNQEILNSKHLPKNDKLYILTLITLGK
jgi:hypothetical protein